MPSDVHFTRAQKWDLVRLSAAAVASTVFFTVPMFLAHPQERGSQVGDHRPGLAEVATASVPNAPVSSASGATTSSPSADDAGDVSVVTSMEFALATTPAMESPTTTAVRTRTGKPAQLRARANTAPPSSSNSASTSSLGRRVARFIAGSGKYNVRPFPTISTSGS
jgi:hypothetical protein